MGQGLLSVLCRAVAILSILHSSTIEGVSTTIEDLQRCHGLVC
jgi:hypothetical protein